MRKTSSARERKSRCGLIAVVALLAVAVSQPPTPSIAADAYEIPVILSLTGVFAFGGRGEEGTFRVAEGVINATGGIHGRAVHFAIEDDQSNPQVAVQLFNSIVGKGAPVMFGPSLGGPCAAVAPLVKTQIVNYCLSPALHPAPGSYSFSATASTTDLVATALRYLRARGVRKLALLQTTDQSGQDGETVVDEDLKTSEFADMQVVDREHFAPGDISVDAQIVRIKASGAQAIISWISGTPFGTVVRAVNAGGLNIPLVTSSALVSYNQLAQYKGFLPKTTLFVTQRYISPSLPAEPAVKRAQGEFYEAMQRAGIRPDTLSSVAWNPIFVVTDALRRLPEGATAQQLHDYLEQTRDYPGINGMMDYRGGNQRGENPLSGVIVRYDENAAKFVVMSKPGGAPL